MNRRNTFLLAYLIGLTISCTPKKESNPEGNAERPNIIYIIADDLGYGDLSCYSQKLFSTPNIDRLAREGMLFTQHYSGSSVCAPSRSTLMTGQHTGHTYIRGNKEVRPEGQHPLPDEIYTLAEALQDAGYTTGAFGKWGLGYPGSEGEPNNQGFDEFYGYNCQRLGHHYYPRHLWHNQDSIVLAGNQGKKKESYAPGLIHMETLKFIAQNSDKPFFLYVPSIIPHAEIVAPEEIMAKHRGKFLPEKSYKGTDSGKNYRQGPYESQPEAHAGFVAMIEILDRQVGEIIDKVEELGLSEKTLIVFTSDNGPHQEGGADPDYFNSNGPLRGYKRDLYEGGIRVPMIARWKGKIKEGTTSNHISAMWDMYATFTDLSNAPAPKNADGLSMVMELMGKKDQQKKHEYLYWEFHEKGGRVAVRKGDWKAVKYNVGENPNVPLELYNLAKDISETNDISAENPQIVKEMEKIMEDARYPSPIFAFQQDTYLNSK